jgi:hypothetical protein
MLGKRGNKEEKRKEHNIRMLEKKEERKKHLIIFDERGIMKWHTVKIMQGPAIVGRRRWEEEIRNKKWRTKKRC